MKKYFLRDEEDNTVRVCDFNVARMSCLEMLKYRKEMYHTSLEDVKEFLKNFLEDILVFISLIFFPISILLDNFIARKEARECCRREYTIDCWKKEYWNLTREELKKFEK